MRWARVVSGAAESENVFFVDQPMAIFLDQFTGYGLRIFFPINREGVKNEHFTIDWTFDSLILKTHYISL